MKTITTKGIVLSRTDYGEADRIIKFLTPEHGKISAIAKGVRKTKSKLAGGIELFSVSDITFIIGRSEIYTLISTRLDKHYGNIVKDLEHTNVGYELIKLINRTTADHPEESYFRLLNLAFEALDDPKLDSSVTALWFYMQLLKLAGHSPNLKTDSAGTELLPSAAYNFDLDNMSFIFQEPKEGTYDAKHIKFLRLGFAAGRPQTLHRVEDVQKLANSINELVATMLKTHVRT
jgi:DNA repair protein RecO (recombination protein O)